MFPKSYSSETIKWHDGDTSKSDPFFILVVNSIALERPIGSGIFVDDFAAGDLASRKQFTACAEYIGENLFGKVPTQREQVLSNSPYVGKVRFWSIYVYGLVSNGATALVGEDGVKGSTIISPRRSAVPPFLSYIGINPDIVFIVSRSPTHTRASAFGTTDDDNRGGITAYYDGRVIVHRYYHLIPGMAAINVQQTPSDNAMTPAHEFGHAFSSYTNGFVTDLYVDGDVQFNRKVGRPIPDLFANYNGAAYASDKMRDSLGYPADWTSYHSELADVASPALMDNFWYAKGGPLNALHDRLTKTYLVDRILAKVSR
ncbi:hypothetical protein [Bradyrhizobium elkanii]|uniref:hypothetical protein n=1 Tax=Bradyrhizobium elkanii TaxID=29448 RepID=UPI0004B8AF2D|nr:hypothetical protein [Bradyrhizobium elkanii]